MSVFDSASTGRRPVIWLVTGLLCCGLGHRPSPVGNVALNYWSAVELWSIEFGINLFNLLYDKSIL
jgi:hypothetical protein